MATLRRTDGTRYLDSAFIATHADIAPVSEFFQASNLFLLNDTARESSHGHAIFQDFESASRQYRLNPFAA